MGVHSDAQLDTKLLGLIKQINLYLNHFPSHEKYGLAQQIRNAAYDVYSLTVEAQKRYHKKTALGNLDVRHEQLRMLVRLANELGYFQFKDGRRIEDAAATVAQRRFHALSLMIDEVGRMIGGWLAAEYASSKRETT